jgi:hypothetical protein
VHGVPIGMRALVLALCLLLTGSSLATADARAPDRFHARTASSWIYNVIHTPTVALRKTDHVFRHVVRIASPCLPKPARAGIAIGDKRAAYLACLGEALRGRKLDPTWTVIGPAKLPRPAHRSWAKSFPKQSVFVVGHHGDGYVVVALSARSSRMGRTVTGVFVDDSLGTR